MGSFLSEIISTLLDKDPQDETEVTYNKFVSSTVDTLKSGKASDEDLLQALRDIGAIMYIGALRLLCFIFFLNAVVIRRTVQHDLSVLVIMPRP